ncbi:MAG: OmpA family protein [Deltaproteobacteria bacterium]|nr:OmpA family protein [Deltaproteobacteria bacterium]
MNRRLDHRKRFALAYLPSILRGGRPIALILFAGLIGASCWGQTTRGNTDAVAKVIKAARANGAYRCAPKELALAEAYLRRTRDELDLGNIVPANDHITLAEKNAKLAFQKSPPERCAPKVVIAPPPPKPKPKPKDRDGDGCLDPVDKCPDQAEDVDGFEDQDCCPDPDNDKDGIPDKLDQCPNRAEDKDGFEDADGCPDLDNDGDGIPDALDKCPNQPEDHDGFEDADGCPDADNDKDKIPDIKDKCPNQPEDYDGDKDDDGCPDKYKLVVVTKKKLELKQKVFFATARTRILPRSFALLNEVANVLKDMPKINVRIEGHTDSRGSARYNQRLSQGRADSVRRYLIQRGVGASRMTAFGYGEDRPVASNRTRDGRAMNRRVEFVITKQ